MSLIESSSYASNSRIAVVLFNLGGPDSLEAVTPFLFNLFNDRAIINIPQPFRYVLARWISYQRSKKAQKIYRQLGGKSPLLVNTLAQGQALERILFDLAPHQEWRVFVAMRYWHPLTETVVAQVKQYTPHHIILLPLYPQYSTTTSQSSLCAWIKEAKRQGLSSKTQVMCCYPTQKGFIEGVSDLLRQHLPTSEKPFRILFSAHGLPQRVIDRGDPYVDHVRQSVNAVMKEFPGVDHTVCYQSKVGNLKWLEPSLDQEMNRAVRDQVGVIIVPISFVSEHSETLIELDKDYAGRARELNLPFYRRTPTVSCHPQFIQGLAQEVINRIHLSSSSQEWACSLSNKKCWCRLYG
jgi:ferrochelatase